MFIFLIIYIYIYIISIHSTYSISQMTLGFKGTSSSILIYHKWLKWCVLINIYMYLLFCHILLILNKWTYTYLNYIYIYIYVYLLNFSVLTYSPISQKKRIKKRKEKTYSISISTYQTHTNFFLHTRISKPLLSIWLFSQVYTIFPFHTYKVITWGNPKKISPRYWQKVSNTRFYRCPEVLGVISFILFLRCLHWNSSKE